MSKKVYGALTEHFILKMRNWALANAGVIRDRSTISSIYSGTGGDSYGESPSPVLIGEAEDVTRALSVMPARYRQAVALFWQREGNPMTWFACRSGVGVDWRTFEKRVIYGHELLKGELARQQEITRNYRAIIKSLETA